MKNLVVTIFLIVFCGLNSSAQDAWMHPNAGQWDDRIEYKVELEMGEMLIEKDGFTYFLYDANQEARHDHDEAGVGHSSLDTSFKAHVIQSKFVGSTWAGDVELIESSSFYRNYYLGNDQSKWKSKLYSYNHINMLNMYDGIDLELDGRGLMKYSLHVSPNTDVTQILMSYEGQDRLFIDGDGNLHVTNRFGEMMEEKPVAWEITDLGRKMVHVEFQQDGNNIRFVFPDGYDTNNTLIIDPTLVFSTFTGSTANNWGMTATPDLDGNLYGGGIVFGAGYPTSPGAFDLGYNGGYVPVGGNLPGFDIAITKFNDIGTTLMYSTYVGGNDNELPTSMYCSDNGELYVLGITGSSDFPMPGTPYDNTHNGGPVVVGNYLYFTKSDLCVFRLNAGGTAMLSSTFVGGSGTDGLNNSNLTYNYGDAFRGEIVLDPIGNVFVSSTSQSVNFPSVGPLGAALGGAQDAVVFKMPANLSSLQWSGYFGGTGEESGNSVQVGLNGDVFVAGGTSSPSLPFGSGYDLTYGGDRDGYVARLSGATGGILSGTLIGEGEYQQAFFVQLDIDDKVYVLGQSQSSMFITAGHYGVANSGQFIHKYSHNLDVLEWGTMVGAGTGNVEISPTAFLVSDCYDIYFSGWGGSINAGSQASQSTSNGFPVSVGAPQVVTNGNNFYLGVLDQDAMNFNYGTYVGGTTSAANHVDGGTSRFDKDGNVYHAVCASCGNNLFNGFTTTPGAYANLAPAVNYACNMAAFKFALSTIESIISTPTTIVCIPDPVVFNNNSSNGNSFEWDFGDGTGSTLVNPTHFYAIPGNYTVTLIVSDTSGCYDSDTSTFVVYIGDYNGGVVLPPGPICPGDSFQFEAYGGANYEWTPAQDLDDPFIATPIATVTQTTDFMVIISDSCGIDTVFVTLEVAVVASNAAPDAEICIGDNVNLFVNGGISYVWSPPNFLDDPFSATPISTPTATTEYVVETTTLEGCLLYDTVLITVYFTPPIPVMPDSVFVCPGGSTDISVSGGQSYAWFPQTNITPFTGPDVTVTPPTSMYYYCDFTNPCGTVRDSVFVTIVNGNITAFSDTTICPGETATLSVIGGVSYTWSPSNTLNTPIGSPVYATPAAPTLYVVNGIDEYGCPHQDSVFVDLFPAAFIQTVPDIHAFYGDAVQLGATSSTNGTFIWSPAEYLSCVACTGPIAQPDQNYVYTVTYVDDNGCSASDHVNIYYDPILYIPNTFTPNNDHDGLNAFFKAEGGNIAEFKMDIYNRWGELIFTANSLDESWDGTYNGAECQDGTYTWKVVLKDFVNINHVHVGHVNIIR